MSSTHTDPVAVAFDAWTEAHNGYVHADRRLAAAVRDARMGILPHQALEQEVVALKAEADRLLTAAMEKLRVARAAAMP